MLSKRYESTEVDRRTWLHVPWGTHWSTSSDTHQVVEKPKATNATAMRDPAIMIATNSSILKVTESIT